METDEEYATVVLRRLDGPLPRTSTVDVGQAMTEGRRRRRMRRLTGLLSAGTATAVVLVAVPVAAGALRPGGPPAVVTMDGSALPAGTASVVAQPPPAPTACTIAKLPVPKGEMSLVTGGDPTGRYLVGRSYPTGTGTRPILIWHDGVVRQVDIPGDDQAFYSVTSTGDAVGSTFLDGQNLAYAFVGGRLLPLTKDPSEARDINAHGLIVGTVNGHAAMWRSALSTPVTLRTPPGDWEGEAYGVDDDGTIVGTLRSNGVERAYMWTPDGAVHELPAPEIDGGPATASRVFRLYAGWATGLAARGVGKADAPAPAGAAAAVRWNLHTGEVQVIPGMDGPVEGVNAYGWVVGSDAKGNAVLVSNAGPLTLPSLVSPVQPSDNIAYVVSDDGRTIAGQSVLGDRDRNVRAVVWHCR